MTPHTYTVTLLSKKNIANQVLELRFSRPENFNFLAGQFIQIIPGNDSSIFRSYSLSSDPSEKYLELCVKVLPNGIVSSFLNTLQINDEIMFRGPFGRFTHAVSTMPLGFVATGVGLAPIMSILEDELENKKNNNPLHLLFGVRNEEDIFWLERLELLHNNFSNFEYILTLSQPMNTWAGAQGRVYQYLDKLPQNARFFLCGSTEMVKDVRALLVDRGTDVTSIHLEIF